MKKDFPLFLIQSVITVFKSLSVQSSQSKLSSLIKMIIFSRKAVSLKRHAENT